MLGDGVLEGLALVHRREVERLAPAVLEEVRRQVVVLVRQVAAVVLPQTLRRVLVVVVEELEVGIGRLRHLLPLTDRLQQGRDRRLLHVLKTRNNNNITKIQQVCVCACVRAGVRACGRACV